MIILIVFLTLLIFPLFGIFFYLIFGDFLFNQITGKNGKVRKKLNKNYNKFLEDIGGNKNFFETFKKVKILSDDNLNLVGYYKNNNNKKIVILFHGFGGNHIETTLHSQFFESQGYDILTVDFRSHGESEGKYSTFGILEQDDVKKWIDYALTLNKQYKILLYGLSMGGSSVLQVCTKEELSKNVIGVVCDSCYTNLYQELKYITQKKYNKKWLIKFFCKFCKRTKGFDLKQYDLEKQLKNIKVQVLFIHSENDEIVPLSMVENSFNTVPKLKRNVLKTTISHSLSIRDKRIKTGILIFLSKLN